MQNNKSNFNSLENIKDIKTEYKIEIERLSLFIDRWKKFTEETVSNYPCDKTRRINAISHMVEDILSRDERENYSVKDKIEEVYKLIDEISFQKPSLYGESENGFNMEDVLNPKGNLDLLELCKELGVDD